MRSPPTRRRSQRWRQTRARRLRCGNAIATALTFPLGHLLQGDRVEYRLTWCKRRARIRLWHFISWLDDFLGRCGAPELEIIVVGARQAGPAAGVNSLIDVDFCMSPTDDN